MTPESPYRTQSLRWAAFNAIPYRLRPFAGLAVFMGNKLAMMLFDSLERLLKGVPEIDPKTGERIYADIRGVLLGSQRSAVVNCALDQRCIQAIESATDTPFSEIYGFLADICGIWPLDSRAEAKQPGALMPGDADILEPVCTDMTVCWSMGSQRTVVEGHHPLDALEWNRWVMATAIEHDPSLVRPWWQRVTHDALNCIHAASERLRKAHIVTQISRHDVRDWVIGLLRNTYTEFLEPGLLRDLEPRELAVFATVLGVPLAADLLGVDAIRLEEAKMEATMNITVNDILAASLQRYGIKDASLLTNQQRIGIMHDIAASRSLELMADPQNTARDMAPLLRVLMDQDHQERENVLREREADATRAINFLSTLAEHIDAWVQGLIHGIESDLGMRIRVHADPVSVMRQWMAGDPSMMKMLGVQKLIDNQPESLDV